MAAQLSIMSALADARRVELLAAARRTRIQWIEDARESSEQSAHAASTADAAGKAKPRRNTATQMLEGTEVAAALPSSVKLLDYLGEIVDDDNADGGGGIGPAMDMHDDMPMPTYESMEGASAYDVLLEKLKHPQVGWVRLVWVYVSGKALYLARPGDDCRRCRYRRCRNHRAPLRRRRQRNYQRPPRPLSVTQSPSPPPPSTRRPR